MSVLVAMLLQTPAPGAAGELAAGSGTEIERSITNLSQLIAAAAPYIALAFIVFTVSLLLARLGGRLVSAVTLRMAHDGNLASLLGGFTSVAVTVLGAISAVLVLFPAYNPLEVLAALAALSVAVSFVFKDMADGFLSGVMILWRKPFSIGDEIKAGNVEGTVVGFTFRSTKVKTYLNELVFVPNAHLYASEVIVRTAFESHVVKLKVGIGYLDDIETGRRTIEQAARDAEGVFIEPAPKAYVAEFGDSSVDFTLFFLTEPKRSNLIAVTDRVATNIKNALDEAGIDMPYPHAVIYVKDAEHLPTKDTDIRRP